MSGFAPYFFLAVIVAGFVKVAYRLHRNRDWGNSAKFWKSLATIYEAFQIGLIFLPIVFFVDAGNAGLLTDRIMDPWTGVTLIFAFFTWMAMVYSEFSHVIADEAKKAVERDKYRGVEGENP